MQTVRLHFSKTFNARYLSHLDLVRCFSRALKKSGLDLWYTEGFNTHLYMTFAMPLSLGVESLCETLDIRLVNDDFDPEMIHRINAGLPAGLEVFNAALPKHKPTEIAFARYLIELDDEQKNPLEIAAAFSALLEQDHIHCEKRSKKAGIKTVDIRPMIDNAAVMVQAGMCRVDLTCVCSTETTLNPSLLLAQLYAKLGKQTDHCLIKRTQILTKNFENFE